MAEAIFYLVATLAVASGVGVVCARSPLMSVLSLLGAFVSLAVIYLLAGFPFLALVQVLVYAGAIMVLFLFVVMLLNLDRPEVWQERAAALLGPRRLAVAVVSAGTFAVGGLLAVGWERTLGLDPALEGRALDDVEALAALLFSRYALPFEATSVLLLATMVGVIVLAKRRAAGRASAADSYPYGPSEPQPPDERGAAAAPAGATPRGSPRPKAQPEEIEVG